MVTWMEIRFEGLSTSESILCNSFFGTTFLLLLLTIKGPFLAGWRDLRIFALLQINLAIL